MERGKIVRAAQKKIPLLQGFSSCKTVHRTVLQFTFFGALIVFFVGLCPTPCKPFEKGLTENFYFLDKNLKFCVLWGVVCAPAPRVSANNFLCGSASSRSTQRILYILRHCALVYVQHHRKLLTHKLLGIVHRLFVRERQPPAV